MKKNHRGDKGATSCTRSLKPLRPPQANHPCTSDLRALSPSSKKNTGFEKLRFVSSRTKPQIRKGLFRNPAENAVPQSPVFIRDSTDYPNTPSTPRNSLETTPGNYSKASPEGPNWPQGVNFAASDLEVVRSSPQQVTLGCCRVSLLSENRLKASELDEKSTAYSIFGHTSKSYVDSNTNTGDVFHLEDSTGIRNSFPFGSKYRLSSRHGSLSLSLRSRCAGAPGFGLTRVKNPARPPTDVNALETSKPSSAGKTARAGKRGVSHSGISTAFRRTGSLRKDILNETPKKRKSRRNCVLLTMETCQKSTHERARISRVESEIRSLVSAKCVVVFSKNNREECAKLTEIFQSINVDFAVHKLDEFGEWGQAIEKNIRSNMGVKSFPAVFMNGTYFGGLDDVIQEENGGQLEVLLGTVPRVYDFDLFVIGGGSGGLAAAKEASKFDKRVGVADFVDPTPMGNSWGLGGTCVNVGCIPKKLMHQAALYGDSLKKMAPYGWDVSVGKHKWSTLVQSVQNHIKSLNWITKKELKKKSVQYFRSHATIRDPHTIELDAPNEPSRTVTTRNILIAIGTRPRYPDIQNARELCITSDDIFSLKHPPGTTLVVGASYVGLECAGFLQALGFDTTVLVRSRVLKGFDEQMAKLVRQRMEERGTVFLDGYALAEIRQIAYGEPPTLSVKIKHEEDGGELTAEYNTVLLAIGRLPQLTKLGVENIGIAVDPQSGRIIGDKFERTSVRNVFVVGDVLHGRPELTPVAIHAGVLLARRLFGKSREAMNYEMVPTTVFTPLEYGAVGISEEEAYQRFAGAVRVYHAAFTPYEHKLDTDSANRSYAKIICVQCHKDWQLTDPLEERVGNDSPVVRASVAAGTRTPSTTGGAPGGGGCTAESGGGADEGGIADPRRPGTALAPASTKSECRQDMTERVVGFHLLSPSAGEVTQGFGVAMRMRLSLEDLATSIGIHPTVAEIFLKLTEKLEGDPGDEAVCCS